jgi:ribonuclease VapC
LALILREEGHESVTSEIENGSGACTVNLAEVVSRCVRIGMPDVVVRTLMDRLPIDWMDADRDLAYRAGAMIAATKPFGLSLGDRFCLALAARENLPAVTADAAWRLLADPLGVQIKMIRSPRG